MPGKVIGTSLGLGYAGTQSRTADAIIQARVAAEDIAFGVACKLNSDNTWSPIAAGDTADVVAGIAVREVVQANTFDPQSNPDYMKGQLADVMTRGNVIVKCQRGTPAAGQAVYVRVAANETYPDAIVGGFEATADGDNTVEVANIEWTTGQTDSNLMAEVTIKTRAKG